MEYLRPLLSRETLTTDSRPVHTWKTCLCNWFAAVA